jgi:hypothetical protein
VQGSSVDVPQASARSVVRAPGQAPGQATSGIGQASGAQSILEVIFVTSCCIMR